MLNPKYIYLQCNPLVWCIGLIGILSSISLVVSKTCFSLKEEHKDLFCHIVLLLLMYICYMVAMLNMPRVMYLYHYLIPLIFSILLATLIFSYIYRKLILRNDKWLLLFAAILFVEIIYIFQYFSPLTYGYPISVPEFNQRCWLQVWMLKNV